MLRSASVALPPAFRITWASPSSRPRARAGSNSKIVWSAFHVGECTLINVWIHFGSKL